MRALQIAVHSHAIPAAMYALVGIAALHAKAGASERAFELATHSWRDPSSNQQTKDRAEKLCIELESQLAAEQIEDINMRALNKPIEILVQEILASSN